MSLEQLPFSASGCVQHCQPPAQGDMQGAQSQVHLKEKPGSHSAEAAGCAPSLGRAHPKMLVKGEAREGLLLWEASCSCSLDCVSQSRISDACLVIPNRATEVGFFSISLQGTTELMALILLPFFCLGPGVMSTSPSHPSSVCSFAQSFKHYEPFPCMENHFMAHEKTILMR